MEELLVHQFGHDTPMFFFGVVESVNDPLMVGRAKVRVFGSHNPDINKLPTDALPWSVPLHPITHSKLTPDFRVGDWVVGFFMDGKLGQQPMIAWVLPAIPQPAQTTTGFAQVQYQGNTGPLTPNIDSVQFRFQNISLTDETAEPSVTTDVQWQPTTIGTIDYRKLITTSIENVAPGTHFSVGTETFKALQNGWKSENETLTHPQFSDTFSNLVQSGLTGTRNLNSSELTQLTTVLAEQSKRDSLKTPLLVFSMGAASDWVSTAWALGTRGAYEENPTINWLKNPAAIIAAGAGIDVLGAWAWTKFVGGNHPRLAAAGLYVATAFRIGLAIKNFNLPDARPKTAPFVLPDHLTVPY